MTINKIALVGALAGFAILIPASAFAATNGSAPITATVTQPETGSLSLAYVSGSGLPSTEPGTPDTSLSGLSFPSTTGGATITSTDSIQVAASGTGYTTYALSTYFSSALVNASDSSDTIPASDLTANIWEGSDTGTTNGSDYPETPSISDSSSSPTAISNAGNTGDASIADDPDNTISLSLAVPSGTPAGTYNGTMYFVAAYQ